MADDLTNVPDIVRRQAEEAMKIFNAAATAATEAGHPVTAEAPKVPEEPVVAAPVADPVPVEPAKKDEAPPAEGEPPAAETPKSLASLATEEMTKEQRYKIMEGMQKAAGRDLSRALAEVRAVRAELDALNKRPPAAAPAQKEVPAGVPGGNVLREQVAEAFGAENVEKFFQLMRQEGFVAQQDLDAVRGEVGNVARNVVQNAQDKFQSAMDDMAPGWTQINQDPKFIEYMNEEEGNTGMSRLEFAKTHLDRHDAPRLARYFVDFGAAAAPAGTAAPAKLDKKKFAAPPSTPGAGKEPEEKVEVATVKASDMARFAREVIIQKYGGNDKAMNEKDAATWKSYLDAQRAGRVLEDK